MNTEYSSIIGKSFVEAFEELIKANREIRNVNYLTFDPAPILQERVVLDSQDQVIIEKALELRSETQLPFLEAALVQCLSAARVPTRILDGVAFHSGMRLSDRELTRTDVLSGRLQQLAKNSTGGRQLAVSSTVALSDGSTMHFPLLDFHCRADNPKGFELVEAVCRRLLNGSALVLRSGRSFHMCGLQLVSEEDLMKFLGRALLYSPIVDRAYIAHHLIEGRCTLRVSQGGRDGEVPTVVGVL